MSADLVDDLHNAEDRINWLERIVAAMLAGEAGARREAGHALGETYCRPSCNHVDQGECDSEDTCGCPCGHYEELAETGADNNQEG